MVLVNVAVFLWPAGDKTPFFESRATDTQPAIKADKMLLLTETVMTDRAAVSSPALAQPSQQPSEKPVAAPEAPAAPTPAVPEGDAQTATKKPADTVAVKPAAESKTPEPDEAGKAKIAAKTDVAVTPITLPSFSKDRKATTSNSQERPDEAAKGPASAKSKPEKTEVAKSKTAKKEKPAEPTEEKKVATPAAESAKAETKTVAKADPAPPKPAGVCVRIGPFSKDEAIAEAGEVVAALGARYTERTVPSRDVRTWRVFAGPFATQQETVDMDTVLNLAGFSDRYVMNDVNGQKFISLGVFSAEKTAEALRERLVDQPMVINVRPEIRQLNPTKWLEVAAPGLSSADKSSLDGQAWPSRRPRVRPINCRPAAG